MCICRGACCSWLFCCFPIRGCTYTFVAISFLLQLAMCTLFLVYEVWYVFSAVAIVILAHLYFIFVTRGQRFCLLHLFAAYSSLWSLVYAGLFVWSILIYFWPDSIYNPFWDWYYMVKWTGSSTWEDAKWDTQQVGLVMMGMSFGSAIIQGYTSRVLFAYKKWLEVQAVKNRLNRHHSSHHSPHVTVITNTPVYTISPPPADPYHPPPPPPPPSAYQQQQYPSAAPVSALLPPQQPAHNQVLPSAPPVSPAPTPDPPRRVYPEAYNDGPSSSTAHLEPPPAYSSTVGEEKGAYENIGYQQKY